MGFIILGINYLPTDRNHWLVLVLALSVPLLSPRGAGHGELEMSFVHTIFQVVEQSYDM